LYILIHKYSFPDEHTTIIFILYYINKKALVWRTEFIVAYTVSGQEIYLRTIEDFFAALDSVFQLFNMAGDILLQMFCNLFIYLGEKERKHPYRVLAKEKHYINPDWL